MSPLAVIGVGTPFGFDRLGPAVIAMLRERAREAPPEWQGVRLEAAARLGGPLLAQLRGVQAAVLLDAIDADDAAAGVVVRLDGRALDARGERLSSHGFGLAQTLATGAQLDELPGKVVVMGLAHGGDPDREPSAEECGRLADAVQAEITRLRGMHPPRWRRGLHAGG